MSTFCVTNYRAYSAGSQLCLPYSAMQLVSEAFDIVHTIQNQDGIGHQLSLHGGKETTPRPFFGSTV